MLLVILLFIAFSFLNLFFLKGSNIIMNTTCLRPLSMTQKWVKLYATNSAQLLLFSWWLSLTWSCFLFPSYLRPCCPHWFDFWTSRYLFAFGRWFWLGGHLDESSLWCCGQNSTDRISVLHLSYIGLKLFTSLVNCQVMRIDVNCSRVNIQMREHVS